MCGAFGWASPAKGPRPLDLIDSPWELVVMDFSRSSLPQPLRMARLGGFLTLMKKRQSIQPSSAAAE